MSRIPVAVAPPSGLPRISVVVRDHGNAHFLADCLDSVLNQSGVSVDVTVVDDRFATESISVAAAYSRNDPRVRLAWNEETPEFSTVVRSILRQPAADLTVWLDSAHLLQPGTLARSAAVFIAQRAVGLVYTTGHPAATPGALIRGPKSWSVWSGEEWLSRHAVRDVSFGIQAGTMIRNSYLAEAADELETADDIGLWFAVARRSSIARINGAMQSSLHSEITRSTASGLQWMLADLQARRAGLDRLLGPAARRHHRMLGRSARAALRRARALGPIDPFVVAEYQIFLDQLRPVPRSPRSGPNDRELRQLSRTALE